MRQEDHELECSLVYSDALKQVSFPLACNTVVGAGGVSGSICTSGGQTQNRVTWSCELIPGGVSVARIQITSGLRKVKYQAVKNCHAVKNV